MSREEDEAVVRARYEANLFRELAPVLPYFESRTVTNIYIYGDGRLVVEDFEKGMIETGISIGVAHRYRIINCLASMNGVPVDTWRLPVLEGIIPKYRVRTTAILPGWLEEPQITFRRPADRIFLLEDYLREGRISGEHYREVTGYIKARRNLVISGSTGSGKTTFTNAVIEKMREFTPEERFYIVEDTPELRGRMRNVTQLYIRKEQAVYAIQTALRWTPKRIIFGEIRSGEVAVELLEAWNTGHSGNVTTVHADSAESTVSRLEGLLRQRISGRLPDISDVIHVIVHLTYRHNFGPVVDEVREVKSITGGKGGHKRA